MSTSRSIPEELIKIKAQTIWEKRQSEGLQDNPESYQIEARQYLEKHPWEVFQWKLTQRLANRPIKRFADWWETTPIEKFILEDIKYLLEESAFLSIISLIAQITIILSLLTWITGKQERWEDEIFATWQVVNQASEDKSGVVKIALERLLRNDFSLAGLKLKNTNLTGANLQEADLRMAKFQEADLGYANFQKADLRIANFQEAYLRGANFQKADLWRANFQGAYLEVAKFQEADLWRANLQGAYLEGANFQEADLEVANLQEAILFRAKNLTPKQIKSACFWDKAIHKGEWNSETETAVVTEPDNTKFIEKLKKDKSSDLQEPDCSRWKK